MQKYHPEAIQIKQYIRSGQGECKDADIDTTLASRFFFCLLLVRPNLHPPACQFSMRCFCAREGWVPLNNESGEGRIDNAGNKLFVYPSLNGIRCLLASIGETRCLSRHVCLMQVCGYIAQWLERLTADQQVPGSNPGVPFDMIRQSLNHQRDKALPKCCAHFFMTHV